MGQNGDVEVVDLGKLTEEAAEVIRKKLGGAGTIIVMASAPGKEDDVYFVCWRGRTLGLLGLAKAGVSIMEARLLQKPEPSVIPAKTDILGPEGFGKRRV